jgi:hypothetical protein
MQINSQVKETLLEVPRMSRDITKSRKTKAPTDTTLKNVVTSKDIITSRDVQIYVIMPHCDILAVHTGDLFYPVTNENKHSVKSLLEDSSVKLIVGKETLNTLSSMTLPCVNGILVDDFLGERNIVRRTSNYEDIIEQYVKSKNSKPVRSVNRIRYNKKTEHMLLTLSLLNYIMVADSLSDDDRTVLSDKSGIRKCIDNGFLNGSLRDI